MKKYIRRFFVSFLCLAILFWGLYFFMNKKDSSEVNWYDLSVNYPDFTISYGEYTAVVSDGKIVSNDLGILNVGAIGGNMDSYLEYGFILPQLPRNSSYLIVNQSRDHNEIFMTKLFCMDAKNGFFTKISSEDSGTIRISNTGNVDTEYETETKQTIFSTNSKVTTSWRNLSISGSDSGFNITIQKNRFIVDSDSENTIVDMEVSGNINSLTCEGISIPKRGMKVHEPKPGICEIRSVGGPILQSAVYGCCVILDSRGGNNMEALKNIPIGSKIEEPEVPFKEGYIFQGWYEETSKTLWDFDTDTVTEKITLYAGWRPEEE